MDRRQFVAGASVGAAAAVSVYPKPAIAQGARELKMVTIWPKGLPGLQSGADRVAQSITALSDGRLQVKVFPAGQLVGAMESFDAVSSGLADLYHASEITWAGKSATFAYFCNVPFGLTADEINAWVYYDIRKVDDTTLQELGKISGEVLSESSRKDDLARRVYASFIMFRKGAVRWGDISERAFLNARALPY